MSNIPWVYGWVYYYSSPISSCSWGNANPVLCFRQTIMPLRFRIYGQQQTEARCCFLPWGSYGSPTNNGKHITSSDQTYQSWTCFVRFYLTMATWLLTYLFSARPAYPLARQKHWETSLGVEHKSSTLCNLRHFKNYKKTRHAKTLTCSYLQSSESNFILWWWSI